ncbi:MAG: multiheme c-type cytochrome [Thermodesulfovibrionales bacterium]
MLKKITLLIIFILFSHSVMAKEEWKRAFEEEYLKILPVGEPEKSNVCIDCHRSEIMRPDLRKIPSEWRQSWHSENNISCHDCHGGDPEDEKMAMSPERGFIGKPKHEAVPEFCGRCHKGILEHYLKSGHGRSLRKTGHAPTCVTCHGSHLIKKASIDIINEKLCIRCHTYERARTMKQALSVVETKIKDTENALKELRRKGIVIEKDEKEFFRLHTEFRALFHTTDVNLVRDRTDEFLRRLESLDSRLIVYFKELNFRRNYSIFFMLLFTGMGLVIYFLYKEKNH